MFGLASSFYDISNFMGYFMLRGTVAVLFTIQFWKDKGFRTFPTGICPKVNIIASLEFEHTHYDVAVKHVCDYAIETSLEELEI